VSRRSYTKGPARHSGCGGGMHREHLSSLMSRVLYKIAVRNPLLTPKKIAVKPRTTGGNIKISDDEVLALLRRHRDGESFRALEEETGIANSTLRQWYSGEMRGYLRDRLDKETK
jgi:hypothetical protein